MFPLKQVERPGWLFYDEDAGIMGCSSGVEWEESKSYEDSTVIEGVKCFEELYTRSTKGSIFE